MLVIGVKEPRMLWLKTSMENFFEYTKLIITNNLLGIKADWFLTSLNL